MKRRSLSILLLRAVPELRWLGLLGALGVGCLNPRPEELPSQRDLVPVDQSEPPADTSGSGTAGGGTAGTPDFDPEVPQGGPGDGQAPAAGNEAPTEDAGVPRDAGTDAEAPGGAGTSPTSE
jgi:hypothetical protein